MDAASWYLLIAVAASFAAAACSAMAAGRAVRARGRASRAYGQALSAGRLDALLRNGIRPLAPLARKMARMEPVGQWAGSMEEALSLTGRVSSKASLCSLAVGASLLLAVAGYAVGSYAAAVALPCGAVMLATAWGHRTCEKHHDLLRDQLPDALRAMSACFHAGLSLSQTFEQLAHEVPAPLGSVFGKAWHRMQTGSSVPEALEAVRAESSLSELAFVSVALQVHHQAGGSMQHVLDAAGDSLESELELKRELRVQTAQARLSARVVVGVTVLLVIALSVLSEGFLSAFFESATGLALLGIAVGMQVAGIVAVRRLLDVEVD